MREILDLAYSQNFADIRKMDLFLPDGSGVGRCILFIHGGGWSGGTRAKWHESARYFCARGYVCASASYRLAPDHVFPAQVEDVRLAMSYLRDNAGRFGFESHRIAAMGSSAGAHLAAMLGTIGPHDRVGITDELTSTNTRPAACVCYCPITYVQLWKDHAESVPAMLQRFIGASEDEAPGLYSAASPADRVSGDEPPFLLVHGDTDALIPVEHSKLMAERLRARGGVVELLILNGAPHGFGYGTGSPHQKESLAKTEAFFDKYL